MSDLRHLIRSIAVTERDTVQAMNATDALSPRAT